jgi:hypothetical protein
MRLKPVPPAPEDRERLRRARRAVPLVPGSEADCCARLRQRLDLPTRDVARTWLTFLRALGLAEETSQGFARTREDLAEVALGEAFREEVFGAREALDALAAADEPLDAAAVFGAVEDVVPQWERHKDPAWRDTWHERVARLLDWAALFGLVERAEGGYRLVEGGER